MPTITTIALSLLAEQFNTSISTCRLNMQRCTWTSHLRILCARTYNCTLGLQTLYPAAFMILTTWVAVILSSTFICSSVINVWMVTYTDSLMWTDIQYMVAARNVFKVIAWRVAQAKTVKAIIMGHSATSCDCCGWGQEKQHHCMTLSWGPHAYRVYCNRSMHGEGMNVHCTKSLSHHWLRYDRKFDLELIAKALAKSTYHVYILLIYSARHVGRRDTRDLLYSNYKFNVSIT